MGEDFAKGLRDIQEDIDILVESIELMSDDEFMASYRRAKLQIAERDFEDWDALQDIADP